ncbi:hypothetical protein J6590_013585 [Homalodisca vitripennis]|nr:hypothetical protein J6590_013585 [Homalodisca vitripennis]
MFSNVAVGGVKSGGFSKQANFQLLPVHHETTPGSIQSVVQPCIVVATASAPRNDPWLDTERSTAVYRCSYCQCTTKRPLARYRA